jgi:transcriptional regulator with XRE-family HTH domain
MPFHKQNSVIEGVAIPCSYIQKTLTGALKKMEKFRKIDFKIVGARIRKARKELKLTQEKAAEYSFITSQFWSLLETGRVRASVNTYWQIASVFGITLDDLFYEDTVTMRIRNAFSRDELLADCTEYEKAIIGEAFLALKGILKKNGRR